MIIWQEEEKRDTNIQMKLKEKFDYLQDYSGDSFEITGNIFMNPELINSQETK